jgi:hypothetical protein
MELWWLEKHLWFCDNLQDMGDVNDKSPYQCFGLFLLLLFFPVNCCIAKKA